MESRFQRLFFWLVVAVTIISTLYWIAFALNAYNTFHEYNDLGENAYNMWVYLNYPATAKGLQVLVIGNHVAPDQLFVLAIFALYQSSVTLLVFQAIIMGLTGFVIFLVARDLTKNTVLSFLFYIAFVLNPGMHGLLVFDYHIEVFMILFYVLTFYFYMKRRLWPFLAASVLLLCVAESAIYLGITMVAGLLLFEYSINKDKDARRARLPMLGLLLLLSVAALILYHAVDLRLDTLYGTGYYSQLSPNLYITNYYSEQNSNLAGLFSGILQGKLKVYLEAYSLYGFVVGILGFGFVVGFDPLVTLIFASGWLTEIFLLGGFNMGAIWNLYFSYVLGGTFAGAMIGNYAATEKTGVVARLLLRLKGAKWYDRTIPPFIKSSLLMVLMVILLLSPLFIYSKNINNLGQDFLFQVSPSNQTLINQLQYVVNRVPNNVSLMAPYFTMPHVIQRNELELIGSTETTYFKPQYVLADFNLNISLNAFSYENMTLYNDTLRSSPGYHIVAENGTAVLWEMNSTGP